MTERCEVCERSLPVLPLCTNIIVAHVCGGVPRGLSISGRVCEGVSTLALQRDAWADDSVWDLGPRPLRASFCALCVDCDMPCVYCRESP